MGGNIIRLGDTIQQQPVKMAVPRPTIYYLIDCSASMFFDTDKKDSPEKEKIQQAREGTQRHMGEALQIGFQAGLIAFGDKARLLVKATRDFEILKYALRGLENDGSTNLTHALQIALEALSTAQGRKIVVVVTDGKPDDSKSALETGLALAKIGVKILTIGTDDADGNFLQKLATEERLALIVKSNQILMGFKQASQLLLPPPTTSK
jgi:Mg-chelatase subunit ChlD